MSDPYTQKAEAGAGNDSVKDKLDEVKGIMKSAGFGMLVTRSAEGHLHSRAMSPVSSDGLEFVFVFNTESGKLEEVKTDKHVNISFMHPSSTNWVSVAGDAEVDSNAARVEKFWKPELKAWFGDLKDGTHTGDFNDPRVAILVIKPAEIRYWHQTRGTAKMAYDVAKGAVTGETAAPGRLRTIAGRELELVKELEHKEV